MTEKQKEQILSSEGLRRRMYNNTIFNKIVEYTLEHIYSISADFVLGYLKGMYDELFVNFKEDK